MYLVCGKWCVDSTVVVYVCFLFEMEKKEESPSNRFNLFLNQSNDSSINNSNNKILQRDETATWKIERKEKMNYKTESEEFINLKEGEGRSLSESYHTKQKILLQNKVILKFEKLIKERYGSIEYLFSTVRFIVLLYFSLSLSFFLILSYSLVSKKIS